MIKLIRKIRAALNKTFVTECPKCFKHFYGFHDYKQHVKISKVHYRYICHRCAKDS